jgi:hypothetical protein
MDLDYDKCELYGKLLTQYTPVNGNQDKENVSESNRAHVVEVITSAQQLVENSLALKK